VPLGGIGQLINGPVASALGGSGSGVSGGAALQHAWIDAARRLLDKMMQQHFIVELDHMDVKTADQALSVLEAHRYSGVISAHSWDSPEVNPRIYNLDGFVTPIAGSSPAEFIDYWRSTRTVRNKRFYSGSGFGYGADMNGLAEQSQPAGTGGGHPINYPFNAFGGGVSFGHEVWGQRTFNHQGWGRQLRHVSRLAARADSHGWSRIDERHVQRRRGQSGDVGARLWGPPDELPLVNGQLHGQWD
jgi:hypothetical protein